MVIFGQFWLGRALYGVWPSAAVPLLKHCLSTAYALPKHCLNTEKSICQWYAAKHTLFTVTPTRNTPPMTVLCPRQTPKLSRLTASPQVLITAGTRIITCVSRVLHVFITCITRGCPWAKFWAVQNFLPRPTPFRFFSASCHVYKFKLDINANIVCFTGDNFLTGFGRDQAIKRCVIGPCTSVCAYPRVCVSIGSQKTQWNR